jgi:hypothetical protein
MAGKAVHSSRERDVTLFHQRLFAAFSAGEHNGHHIQNRFDQPGIFLAVGSRRPEKQTAHYSRRRLSTLPDPDGPVALLEIDGEIAVYLNSQVVSPITRIPFLTLSLTEPNHSDGKLAVRLVLDTQLICYSRFSRMKLMVT